MDDGVLRSILLEPEQQGLLGIVVEAARNVPPGKPKDFDYLDVFGGSLISHVGLRGSRKVHKSDIEMLCAQGLPYPSYGSRGLSSFVVTPLGFRYYEEMKQHFGQQVRRVQGGIREYIDGECLQQQYARAFQRWALAEDMLWSSDSRSQLTTIGHHCREAMQEFVTALVEEYEPGAVSSDPQKAVARLRAVLEHQAEGFGKTERQFLDALIAYWGTVSDLVQRQEHGGQKEGEPLVWEDGRRVVFHTMIVMFEVDRALSRTQ